MAEAQPARRTVWLALTLLLVAFGTLFWFERPASSGEWAAWIQTFGVVMAVIWALRLQKSAAASGFRQTRQVATLFAANMHWVFRELSDATAKKNWQDFRVHRRILEEVLAQGREVTLQMLDARSLAMVTSLRSIAVEALELTLSHTEGGNWAYLHAHFEKRLPAIAGWLSAAGHPPENSGPTDYVGLRTSLGALDSHL